MCPEELFGILHSSSTSPSECIRETNGKKKKTTFFLPNKFSPCTWIVYGNKQWLQHVQVNTETVLPQLFCCAKCVEVLHWVGTVASVEEDSINTLLSFWNMKEEHWHYWIVIMIFCKELNILNAKIWLSFYNYPSQKFLCALMLFCWSLVL